MSKEKLLEILKVVDIVKKLFHLVIHRKTNDFSVIPSEFSIWQPQVNESNLINTFFPKKDQI